MLKCKELSDNGRRKEVVEIVKQQNKIKFIVDDTEYKTITEVINKYDIVPKLFSKKLINDKYEIRLNKLEHEKDIEKF